MELSRQEYRSGLPFPPLGDLPDSGNQTSVSFISCLSCIKRILYHCTTWERHSFIVYMSKFLQKKNVCVCVTVFQRKQNSEFYFSKELQLLTWTCVLYIFISLLRKIKHTFNVKPDYLRRVTFVLKCWVKLAFIVPLKVCWEEISILREYLDSTAIIPFNPLFKIFLASGLVFHLTAISFSFFFLLQWLILLNPEDIYTLSWEAEWNILAPAPSAHLPSFWPGRRVGNLNMISFMMLESLKV